MVYLHSTASNNIIPFPIEAATEEQPLAKILPDLCMVEHDHPERTRLEQYIHDRFAREYGADINSFMPYLVKLGNNHKVDAALGFRTAPDNRLFLETYLEKPVQEELAEITGLEITREKIIEVGNLAATRPGSSTLLFAAMSCFLDSIGYEWVVISATPTVQNIFSKLQIPLFGLAVAHEDALPAHQKSLWGTYYQTRPLVLAVHVGTAQRCVKELPISNRLLHMIEPSIEAMVENWRLRHV